MINIIIINSIILRKIIHGFVFANTTASRL